MNAGTGIADLSPRDEWKSADFAGRRGRPACALGDVFIDLTVFIRTWTESLDRRVDHARVDLLDLLPGKAHPIDRAGREVFDHHIAFLDELCEDLITRRRFRVQRHAALVAVQHREIETVH